MSNDGTAATLTQNGRTLVAQILSPAKARFEIFDAAPLPSSPHPEKQNGNRGIRKLAIHLEKAADVRLAVLFNADLQAPALPTRTVPLADW